MSIVISMSCGTCMIVRIEKVRFEGSDSGLQMMKAGQDESKKTKN